MKGRDFKVFTIGPVEGKAVVITGSWRAWTALEERVRSQTAWSDASEWLQGLTDKQRQVNSMLSTTETDWPARCRSFARGIRAQLETKGIEVLSNRAWNSYAGGDRPPIPVRVPNNYGGQAYFESAREAGRALGVSGNTILKRIRRGDPGYEFANMKVTNND